jgi:hypothetical protein
MNLMNKKMLVLLALVFCNLQIFTKRPARKKGQISSTKQVASNTTRPTSNISETRQYSNNNIRTNRWRSSNYNVPYNNGGLYFYDDHDYGPYYDYDHDYDYDDSGAIASTAGLIGGTILGATLANR